MSPKAAPQDLKYLEPYRPPGNIEFDNLNVGDIVRVEIYPGYTVFGGQPKQSKYKLLVTHINKKACLLKGFDMISQQNVDLLYLGDEAELFLESTISNSKKKK